MSAAWKHDELAADLAAYLLSPDRMVWTDMQLGPSGSPRPDVYTIQKSYSKPMPMAFEIKVSRSDMRSDTTSGKWQSYLQFASAVTFAVPDGLCTVADIPDGCGLIVRKTAAWRYVRRPTIQKVTPPFSACMKLLIDGVSRTYSPRQPIPRRADLWTENEAVRKRFGQAVAIAAKDLARALDMTESAKTAAQYERDRIAKETEAYKARLRKEAEDESGEWIALRNEILEWLDCKSPSAWAVRNRLAELKRSCDADPRVERADRDVSQVRRGLEQLLRSLPQEQRETVP